MAILDVDPDLARDMDAERAAAARSHAIAAIETLAPGEWPAEALDIIEPREGEILRPWDTGIELVTETPAVTWNVLVTARIAILDGRFVARTARWPELTTAVVARAIKRSRALAVQLAICNLQRVETRLVLLMWHLAERWGKVSPDGIVLPLGLTHRMLASLVGARRPTVTTALKELTAQNKVTRREDGMWVLRGEPPAELGQMYATLS